MAFYTYLLASAPYGTLYCGHTDNLAMRIRKHREKVYPGFTARYGVSRLVWYEVYEDRANAFRRERRIKKWERAWKIRLIEAQNPLWEDLYETLNCRRRLQPLVPAQAGTQAELELALAGWVPLRRRMDPRLRGDERVKGKASRLLRLNARSPLHKSVNGEFHGLGRRP